MKGLARYVNSVAIVYLIGLLLGMFEAQGAILTAVQLLDQKVEELNRFVEVVETAPSKCDALNSCTADTCTRLACYQYGIRGDPNYSCLEIQNNTACGFSCVERNFDYSRSFLRRVDQIDERIARTVCTYRGLDDAFKTSSIADKSHFFRAFFASVDGVFRIYPGADENCEKDPYDPRVRPWYLEAISVPKVVSIVVDSGLNMRTKLPGGASDETYGSKAVATVLRLLDTLREDQDYVAVTSFDGDGTKALNATSIYNKKLMYQYFSNQLTSNVNTGNKMNTNASATSAAINATTAGLTNPSIPANYLKVVVLLTSQNLQEVNISGNPGVNLFVYNFLTTAPQCNPALRASIEEIPPERFDNPLYALRSYFSFLAHVHRSFMGEDISYGTKYEDYSGVDSSTLSLSKAGCKIVNRMTAGTAYATFTAVQAFGGSGELLGVVAIDFYERKVNQQYPTIVFQSIVDAARSRQPTAVFDASTDLNTSVCFNEMDACPGLDTTSSYVQGFLCKPKSGDSRIGCCGKCIPKKNKLPIILGGTFAGVVLLLVILGCCCYFRRRNATKTKGRKVVAGSTAELDGGAQKAPGNVHK